MKKVSAIIFFLFLAVPVWGQENIKIGFVDYDRAMNESEPGKRALEKWQAEFKKAEADLLKEEQELEQFRKDIEKKGLLLKEQERRNLEKEFQRRGRDYQRRRRDFQEELRQRRSELMAEIVKGLAKVVTEIGKEEEFILILERSQMLYMDREVDITDKVIERYNNLAAKKVTKTK